MGRNSIEGRFFWAFDRKSQLFIKGRVVQLLGGHYLLVTLDHWLNDSTIERVVPLTQVSRERWRFFAGKEERDAEVTQAVRESETQSPAGMLQ